MAKDPAFLFYPNDWIGGTMGMTFEEKGAYMELLMMQFNRGHMDARMIAQTVGQLWDNIKDKFEQDEQGKFYNKRLEEEKIKRKKFSESRRNNLSGVNQHTKKKKTKSHKEGHKTKHMTIHMENVNEDVNENKNEYENYVKAWFDFFQEQGLPKPGFDGAQGNALKQIITKITESSTNGNPLESFRYILKNWQEQDAWIRGNALDLKIFNQKFNVIINALKNGRKGINKQRADYLTSRKDI